MLKHLHLPTIRGAGGKGGGAGGTIGEAPDTVRSTQVADVLDLLSEGEVEGLTHGLQSIYLDGVALQNADESFNFDGVQVAFTPGTQGQASIAGADGVQNEVGVGVVVPHATPVVRTITNPAIDRCRVTISIPTLTETDVGDGDVTGSSFEWAIDVQSAGGGYVEVLREVVAEKVISRYSVAKVFALTGPAPWNVRVRRVSADSATAYIVNEFAWASYTEIQSLRLRHPNSAMARIRVNAQQFSRIPTRAYDLMGIRVQVPSNYDPIAKTYTGIWDGTFVTRWTDSPPWIWYAVLTNTRFGLGRYFPAGTGALKWALYRIGRYCDEMVPDGNGGMEPRFRCGVEMRTREQAFKVLSDLAAIFRGMNYWAASEVAVVQDAPADPVVPYTPANVVGGRFTYSTSSASKRPTQVTVWFNDIAQLGKLVPETVKDRDAEKAFGIRAMPDLNPLGVWSRGQAHRVGKWALFSERYEGEMVSLRVGLDGHLVAPGGIFPVADPNEAGERLGGRVHSATTAAVTLDAPVTLASGEAYELSVMVQDPDNAARLLMQKRAVTTGAGTTSVLAVSPAFTQAPAPATVWVLQSEAVQPTFWRCLSVAEVAGTNEFEITGLRHYPTKYDVIEQGIAFEQPSVSRIASKPQAPATLDLVATVYSVGSELRQRVTVGWPDPVPGLQFLVSWQLNGGPYTDLPATSKNCVDIDNLTAGELQVAVRSRNSLGNVSKATVDALTLTATAPKVRLVASAPTFTFDTAGAPKPAAQTVTLRAELENLVGTATITATGYTAAGASLGALTLGGAGNSRTLTVANFGTAAYAVVQATLGAYSDQVPLARVQDGAEGQGSFTMIVGTGARYAGGVLSRTATGTVWDVQAYSAESYRDAAYLTFQAVTTNCDLMIGLNEDPTTDASYASLDFAWYLRSSGTVDVYESSVYKVSLGAYAADDGFSVLADGDKVRFLKNGTVLYTSATSAAGRRFFFDSSFVDVGGAVKNIKFGPMGRVGADGTSTYLHIKWSNDGGSTFTASSGETPGAYIGVVTDSSPTDPTTVGAYTWALVKGADGTNGLPGAPGADGLPSYLHIKWSNDGGTTFTASSGETPGAYIGTVTDSSPGDPGSPGAYTWALVKGADGTNGLPGAPGADGLPSYLHIKWSNDGGTTFTASSGETPGAYIGTVTDSSPGDPGSPGAYTWALVKGADGTNGLPGAPGANGLPSYLHIKWSNDGGTTFTASSGETPGAYIGTVTDSSPGDPGSPGAYTWALIKGADGTNGTPGTPGADGTPSYVHIKWSNDGGATFTASSGETPGLYIGVVTDSTPADPTTVGAYTWALVKGADGSAGTSVFTGTVWIQASSPPSAPTGGSFNFSTSVLTPPSGYSVEQPAVSSTPTYNTQFTFSSPTPGGTATGGTWSTPALVAQVGTSGPMNPGPYPNSTLSTSGATCVAGIRFLTDGNVARKASGTSSTYNNFTKWFNPTGGTPGNSYWIAFTQRSLTVLAGSPTVGGVGGGFLALSSSRTVTLSAAVNASGSCVIDYLISSDSSGNNIVAFGVVNLTSEAEP